MLWLLPWLGWPKNSGALQSQPWLILGWESEKEIQGCYAKADNCNSTLSLSLNTLWVTLTKQGLLINATESATAGMWRLTWDAPSPWEELPQPPASSPHLVICSFRLSPYSSLSPDQSYTFLSVKFSITGGQLMSSISLGARRDNHSRCSHSASLGAMGWNWILRDLFSACSSACGLWRQPLVHWRKRWNTGVDLLSLLPSQIAVRRSISHRAAQTSLKT